MRVLLVHPKKVDTLQKIWVDEWSGGLLSHYEQFQNKSALDSQVLLVFPKLCAVDAILFVSKLEAQTLFSQLGRWPEEIYQWGFDKTVLEWEGSPYKLRSALELHS